MILKGIVAFRLFFGRTRGSCRALGKERRGQGKGEEAFGLTGRMARQRGCGGKESFLSPPPLKHHDYT
jgi:hypothetical protein